MREQAIEAAARAAYEEFYLGARTAEWDNTSDSEKVHWYRVARGAVEAYILASR